MRKIKVLSLLAGVVSLSCAAVPLRAPSVPLVSVDPFFSVWSPADKLSEAPTEHWCGQAQPMAALLRVDGKTSRLLGAEPSDVPAMPQTGCTVWPLRTVCVFEDGAVQA